MPRAGHPWVPQDLTAGTELHTVGDGGGTCWAWLVPSWGLVWGDREQPSDTWHGAGTLLEDRSDSRWCHHPLPGDMGVSTQQ